MTAAIAIGATLIGVAVAALIDLARSRRERRERGQAALRNFRRELAANRRSSSSNLMLLKTELKELEERTSLGHVNALERLQEAAWTLVYLELPDALLAEPELLGEVETLLATTRRINADIEARERFHLQHLAGDPDFVAEGLLRFARILIHPQEDLLRRIETIDPAVAKIVDGGRVG